MSLLKIFADVFEISNLFKVSGHGMLLKVQRESGYETLSPGENGRFSFRESDQNAILLAIEDDEVSSCNEQQPSSSSASSSRYQQQPCSSNFLSTQEMPSVSLNIPSIHNEPKAWKMPPSKKRFRGNSAGNKCVPPFRKTVTNETSTITTYRAKTAPKEISISEVVSTSNQSKREPRTMFKISVDLAKIERTCGSQFTVMDVAEELKQQLLSEDLCIITDVKGFPIKDSPAYRGKIYFF